MGGIEWSSWINDDYSIDFAVSVADKFDFYILLYGIRFLKNILNSLMGFG